jgi:hypothetical protein
MRMLGTVVHVVEHDVFNGHAPWLALDFEM